MLYIIRKATVVCFIFLAAILAGCDTSAGKKQANVNAKKPLVTPRITSDRPKIIAFGDSLTAGFGLAEKESYPYLLQERLKADGYDYEVINAGVSGDTSIGGLERVDWVFEQANVEIMILELGANDLLRNIPVARMKENLGKILKKAKAKNVKVLFCGMFAPDAMGVDYQRDYMSAFPDLASEYDVEYLPFLLEGVALNKKLNQPDGIHPNAEGEKIMTDTVYRALKPLLAK
jgi:acyl-CoA thioesterase-1